MQRNFIRQLLPVIVLIAFSCDKSPQSDQQASTAKQYRVFSITPRSATLGADYPATIEGQQNIEIRPKIDGYIETIHVDEGAIVKKGQKLFEIMAPQYEQEVRTATANIKIAESDVKTAEMEVERVRPLVEKNIISKYELESAEFDLQSRKAALAQARASLANARTNLGYTIITGPVDGIVGTIPYRIGSLVNSSTPQPLTTVSNIDRIYAYFSINEKQALEASRNLRGKTTAERLASIPPVTLILSNGDEFPHKGKVETASGLINTSTGSLRVRATFPNPERIVRSGSSGTVRIPTTVDSAIIIPQQATYEIQGKRFVYKVGEENKVRSQQIEVMDNTGGQFFVVSKGLAANDIVVIEGVATLREDLVVEPREVPADSVLPKNVE